MNFVEVTRAGRIGVVNPGSEARLRGSAVEASPSLLHTQCFNGNLPGQRGKALVTQPASCSYEAETDDSGRYDALR